MQTRLCNIVHSPAILCLRKQCENKMEIFAVNNRFISTDTRFIIFYYSLTFTSRSRRSASVWSLLYGGDSSGLAVPAEVCCLV